MNDFGINGLKSRLQGMVIRDEFLCPIMYQLFRDPVVAQDGHTYERASIEHWFESHSTSPRTGKVISKGLVPNLNIGKLIEDLIAEGGTGLYTHDSTNSNRNFYVFAQKILILKCLGPVDSSWNMKSFEVSPIGCVGGRKVSPDRLTDGTESVSFADCTTISRNHFEIRYDSIGKYYTLRDLGSAGGTFVRIVFGKKKLLTLGTILLFGKHQFLVSDMTTNDGVTTSYASDSKNCSEKNKWFAKLMESCGTFQDKSESKNRHVVKVDSDTLQNWISDADELLRVLSENVRDGVSLEISEILPNRLILQAKVRQIRDGAAEAVRIRNSTIDMVDSKHTDAKQDVSKKLSAMKEGSSDNESDDDDDNNGDVNENEKNQNLKCKMVLTCFAPEGSPLLGKTFEIDHNGAGIGRKSSLKIPCLTGDDRSFPVDTAISSEHARIEFDKESGSFFLCDGSATKPSTNGSWYRLSPPSQKSAPHELRAGAEILIGSIRFQVHERTTLTEETIVGNINEQFSDDNDDSITLKQSEGEEK